MKRNFIHYIMTAAVGMSLTACLSEKMIENPNTEESSVIVTDTENAIPGQILIKFHPQVSKILDEAQITKSIGGSGIISRSCIPSVDEVLDIISAYKLERVFPEIQNSKESSREAGLHLWYMVHFDESKDLNEVAVELSRLGEVSAIEFNREFHRNYNASARPVKMAEKAPTYESELPFKADPELAKQWHYVNTGDQDILVESEAGSDAGCLEAWKKCTGDPSVIVAIMDEGVDWSHPDLQANMWVNEGEIYGSNEDNDGNGYAGDVFGYNFSMDTGRITVDNGDIGHGTHVAGTVAAVNGNDFGVCGIAGGDGSKDSGVKLMSIQIYSGSYGCTVLNQARGIKYAADNGAVILQCSWGYMSGYADPLTMNPGPKTDEEYSGAVPLLEEALDYFIHHAGSPDGVIDGGLVIFASGNEGARGACYPGAYGDYISVSAIAGDYSPTCYTNYEYRVDISAPGGDMDRHNCDEGSVLSTMPMNIIPEGYGYMDGTSMACPHVSGIAALGLSYATKLNKHFRAEDYKKLLLDSSEPLDPKLNGKKLFHFRSTLGVDHPYYVDVSAFRGKMGVGMAKADRLLAAIDGSDGNGGAGVGLILPNAYVSVCPEDATPEVEREYVRTIDLIHCFKNGTTATFTAMVADNSVAEVTICGGTATVKGLKPGRTSFTVKSSEGEEQTSYITVRKTTNDNGWL